MLLKESIIYWIDGQPAECFDEGDPKAGAKSNICLDINSLLTKDVHCTSSVFINQMTNDVVCTFKVANPM